MHWTVCVLLCNYHCNHWSENKSQTPLFIYLFFLLNCNLSISYYCHCTLQFNILRDTDFTHLWIKSEPILKVRILHNLALSISVVSSNIWSMASLLQAMYLHYNWRQNTALLNTICVLFNLSPVINDVTGKSHTKRERDTGREFYYCYFSVTMWS